MFAKGSGRVLAVHYPGSFLEMKQCLRGTNALCAECARWPGSLPSEGERETEGGAR
jgi:hypothetical protein